MVSLVVGSIGKGDFMFSNNLRDAYFQIPIHLDSQPCLQTELGGKVCHFKTVLQSFYNSPGLHQCLLWFQSRLTEERFGFCLIWMTGWWLQSWFLSCFIIAKNSFNSARTWVLSSTWRSHTLNLSAKLSISGCLTDTIWERVFPVDSWIVRLWELVSKFLLLPAPPAKMWKQLLGHMVCLQWFIPRGRARMWSFQWQLKMFWLAALDNPVKLIPLSEEYKDYICRMCL